MNRKRALLLIGALAVTAFSTGRAADQGWELIFRDDFSRPRPDHWEKATHTFDQNAARFRPENVEVADGRMRLTLKKESFKNRRYTGGELRTRAMGGFHKYGRFEVRMKAARGGAVVSSFFTYRYQPWQEIDIEFLGKDTTKIHLNIFFNDGPEGRPHNNGDLAHQTPVIIDLGFDAAADFHDYAFEWEPDQIRWFVDGRLIHTESAKARSGRIPDLPQQVMMNLWYSEYRDWAGAPDDSKLPAVAEYDSVALYKKTK